MNTRLVLVLGLAVLFCPSVKAQSQSDWKACPVMATLPADLDWTKPLEHRQRFELRQCNTGLVIVTAYEKQSYSVADIRYRRRLSTVLGSHTQRARVPITRRGFRPRLRVRLPWAQAFACITKRHKESDRSKAIRKDHHSHRTACSVLQPRQEDSVNATEEVHLSS
jgi:hypothetical protein